jgi:hypothetical protein
MSHYDVQQVCLNGHQVTDNYNGSPEVRENFCSKCGEKTINQCPDCQHPIRGYYHVDGVVKIGFTTPVPTHCDNCGKPFPWTLRKEELSQLVSESNKQNSLKLVEQICSRFHLVAKQLRSRYSERATLEVNDEYDTQDLLHSLLRIYFDDIRPEEWAPSYAGGNSRIDFLLKEEQIIIEVKKTRKTLKVKQIGDELLGDIQRYQKHPDCKKLICFVYDPEGWISNPRGLENDLARNSDDFIVKVVIVPKGY